MNSKTFKWLLNPAEFTAGFSSLLIGVVVMAVASVGAYFYGAHFDGVIDLHFSKASSLEYHFIEVFSTWIILSLLLFISGKIFSNSAIRIIDVFGTQALVKLPMIPSLLTYYLINPLVKNHFVEKLEKQSTDFAMGDMILLLFIAVIIILITFWMVVWMYRAYCIACNIKGNKAVLSFLGVMLIAEIASKVFLHFLGHYMN